MTSKTPTTHSDGALADPFDAVTAVPSSEMGSDWSVLDVELTKKAEAFRRDTQRWAERGMKPEEA